MINTKLFSMFGRNLDFNSYLMFTCTINCFSFYSKMGVFKRVFLSCQLYLSKSGKRMISFLLPFFFLLFSNFFFSLFSFLVFSSSLYFSVLILLQVDCGTISLEQIRGGSVQILWPIKSNIVYFGCNFKNQNHS